ncbi:hypothetical protein O6H91_19G022400 [Diphasiastrum complanatum]|uniref:Uncharacterized protein n=4 Tax=Diphasiastrum complanatum TaxID=34168 RepID=A0ACC2ATC0_DIPCM|nr:hypothetical protein O6H91_19G022400 [Diphasiastrum complanatum]KAJ7520775.1 hypothetical protein O6H91_19G022400 [Diphasiastrum complanatum]KAJ7520776.1 hypothetical protein O6H91_19G022400 [Diphasiastrum complanatum]KAJ7520777.1 hypothetical protein O6H91_19G022400 [Diphasiastrum complanatum]
MRTKSKGLGARNSQGVYLLGSTTHDKNVFLQPLADIEEDDPMYLPSPTSYPPPETPQEPMEFLSRTWSVSAVDVARALAPGQPNDTRKFARGTGQSNEAAGLETAQFTFASTLTSKMVMDRILAAPTELPLVAPRRNSHSNGPLICHYSGPLTTSPPPSPRLADDLQNCRIVPSLRLPFHGRSVRKWLKDLRERRKETTRVQNAQVHAAVCVSAVAAAIAAVAAATASSAIDDGGTKTSTAVASAASLVAAHCVELAESMGADRQQVAAVVSSAVNVKTAGDVMTLTAAAATALRGAATLKARNSKETRRYASVAPYERGGNYSNSLGSDVVSEDSEAEYYTQELLAKGCEFLKRSKSGELNWRFVYIFLDKHGQVVVKLQSKHVGGALKKTKKSIVIDLYPDIPAWPGRNLLENGEQLRYFGLKTNDGVTEFECRSVYLHKLWTQGISHLLAQQQQQYH